MFGLFLFLLQVAGCIAVLFALFVFFHVVRPQKAPADASNRINKIRLLWMCLTREELFADTFPWMKNDEYDNVKHVE